MNETLQDPASSGTPALAIPVPLVVPRKPTRPWWLRCVRGVVMAFFVLVIALTTLVFALIAHSYLFPRDSLALC